MLFHLIRNALKSRLKISCVKSYEVYRKKIKIETEIFLSEHLNKVIINACAVFVLVVIVVFFIFFKTSFSNHYEKISRTHRNPKHVQPYDVD